MIILVNSKIFSHYGLFLFCCFNLAFRRLFCLEGRAGRSGSTEMRVLSASSNFSGYRDTGFAFGIFTPQKASSTDYRDQLGFCYLFCRVGNANMVAFLTFFYDCFKDVWQVQHNRPFYPLTLSYLPLKKSFLISLLYSPVSVMFPSD